MTTSTKGAPNLSSWVASNIDVFEQRLIGLHDWKASELLWSLTDDEESDFFAFYDQFEIDLWASLNAASDARGETPLEILNDWSEAQGITITSPESMKKQLLRWCMARVCWQNARGV